jgi:hypothetical protein
MTDLPDVNVWIALTDVRQVHHETALRYWPNGASECTVYCGITMLAFLRLITQERMSRSSRAFSFFP